MLHSCTRVDGRHGSCDVIWVCMLHEDCGGGVHASNCKPGWQVLKVVLQSLNAQSGPLLC